MRIVAFLLATGIGSTAYCQVLGTKKDVVGSMTAPSGPAVAPTDLLQMVMALLIVGGLVKWVLPKVVSKLGRSLHTPLGSTIRVEESASFGGGQLQVVSVRGRTLLLAVTANGVNCLSDLTEAPQAAEPPVFFDVLDQADPTRAVVTTDDPQDDEMTMEDAVNLISAAKARIEGDERLERLNRLTGVL